MNNNSLSQTHTKWDCSYHIIFIPKYRRKIMYKEIRKEIGKILRRLCEFKKIELVEGSISIDHVHMYVKIPPKEKISDFMGYLKGKSALMIFDKYPDMRQKMGRHFWAKGYYISTIGIDKELIKKYIREQEEADLIEDRITKK